MDKRRIEVVGKWGEGWQLVGEWKPHTIGPENASDLVEGYLRFLNATCNYSPGVGAIGLDVGAGAGYLAGAFSKHGIDMVASEWSDAGIDLIKRENPELKTHKLDVLDYCAPNAWDLIFCRELYPLTRVNAFTDQAAIISRLVDSLKPGGMLLLVASDVSSPNCLDQKLLVRMARRDPRISCVTGMYPEALIRRLQPRILGRFWYWLVSSVLSPLVAYKKRRGWAAIYVIGLRKTARPDQPVTHNQSLGGD